jgi:hypothetical protein
MRFFSAARTKLNDPVFTTEFHKYATFTWILLVIPSFLWWKESIAWVVFMSVWANVAGHWSSYQASRVERKQDES